MVQRFLGLMYKEVRGLHQAAYILALFAFGSQLLAIVRDRLLAHVFGAGQALDLYYSAFRIPDFLFVLFASVVSVYVLLPFINRASSSDLSVKANDILSQIFTLFVGLFTVSALFLAVTAPWYVDTLFPGFYGQYETLTILLRILLVQAFLLGVSNLCGVVTQASNRFILFAVSPILYNFGIILGLIVLYPLFGLPGLVVGVVIGAFLHLGIQVPFVLRSSYSFSLTRNFDWKLIASILKVAIPRGFTLSVNQFVLLIFTGVATTMAVGSVAVFQFAFNLQSVPLAIIGMSYSVAAFPTLSRLLAEGKQTEFNAQLITALRHIIFWSVPAVFLIIVLRAQIVRVLLGSGAFDWGDTRLTAAVLAVFVVSLVAQAILLLLIRAFYAGGRTVLPLLVATFSGIVGIISALSLVRIYEESSAFAILVAQAFRLEAQTGSEVLVLALAFVIMQSTQLIILGMVSRNVLGVRYRPLVSLTAKAALAGLGGALAAYVTLNFVVVGINQNTFVGIALQGMSAGIVGLVMTGLLYRLLRAPEINEIYRSFRVKIFKTDVLAEQN